MITVQQAKDQLSSLFQNGQTPSLAQLQSIASQLSHSVPGTTSTLLYSGGLGTTSFLDIAVEIARLSGGSVGIINNTDVAQFLESMEFKDALSRVIGHAPEEPEFGRALYGSDGFFGDASARFASEASGPVRTLSSNALFIRPDGALPSFAHVEVPGILNNPSITSVDGIETSILRGIYNDGLLRGLTHLEALKDVFDTVRAKSLIDMAVTDFRVDTDGKIKISGTWFDLAHISDVGHIESSAFGNGPLAAKSLFGISLPDFVDMHGTGIKLLKGLGALGIAGDLIEGLYAATQAHEQWQAGNRVAALDTVGEFLAGVAGSALFLAPFAPFLIPLLVTGGPAVAIMAIVGLVGLGVLGDMFGKAIYHDYISPLLHLIRDPLILDLDGDGIELSALAGSNVHFDYDGDGFAERTGWVSADDGILVIDRNGNGAVDGGAELFGSATQDGFAVLETFDSNGDGKIDASDTAFGQMRVWRDLDQDGIADAGELQTLTQAGITSISLARTDLPGTNAGHGVGYQALFTRADGSTEFR